MVKDGFSMVLFCGAIFLPLSFIFFVGDEKENPGAIARSGVLLVLVAEA
jgi:hypothetical protein